MSIIAPIALLTISGRRDHLLCVWEFFLALVGPWVKGGVINIWPVKPFETVVVIRG